MKWLEWHLERQGRQVGEGIHGSVLCEPHVALGAQPGPSGPALPAGFPVTAAGAGAWGCGSEALLLGAGSSVQYPAEEACWLENMQ